MLFFIQILKNLTCSKFKLWLVDTTNINAQSFFMQQTLDKIDLTAEIHFFCSCSILLNLCTLDCILLGILVK